MKLSRTAKKKVVKALYDEVLASLEGEPGTPVQSPIAFPWLEETAIPTRSG